MKNNIFYDVNKTISRNAMMNFIIGERGVGKSYGFKCYIAKRFLKKGKKFIYVRRYKEELKKAIVKGKNGTFFNQIAKEDFMKGVEFENNMEQAKINGMVCGYFVTLSTSNILKSSTFEDVDTIIFDEFLLNKGAYHYLQNEVIQFLDLVESVARLKDIKCFLIGNATSSTNPYFDFFNVHLPYNSEYQTFKNGTILVNYIKNENYRKIKRESKFGSLIKDTPYSEYAIENKFLLDNKSFIKKTFKQF